VGEMEGVVDRHLELVARAPSSVPLIIITPSVLPLGVCLCSVLNLGMTFDYAVCVSSVLCPRATPRLPL
jgi:hypothetical protein